jgi:hypothetical protein
MRSRRALSLGLVVWLLIACAAKSEKSEAQDAGGGADGGGDPNVGGASNSVKPVACGVPSGMTACVKECGEPDMLESTAAKCVDGFYTCQEPLIPAIACPSGSWPTGPEAGCGPWVMGYDCLCQAYCDLGRWICPSACPNKGGS